MTRDEERILVLAPFGRDALLLCGTLSGAGLHPVPCSVSELLARMGTGAGAVLLTEEALSPAVMPALLAALSTQESWSDLPLVLLADAEGASRTPRPVIRSLRDAGNLTVLERPLQSLTLVTTLHSALRARRRQYELRELIGREQAARRELEAASRVKDEFLATVSHELRTPIGAILLWTRLLRAGGLDASKAQMGMEAIERSARAQSKLVEDLLDVARMISGTLALSPQPTDLAALVSAAMEIVRPAADARSIRLETDLEAVPQVRVDPDRIQQVVWNLLSNAVKFTPPGGRVGVRLSCVGGGLQLEVSDTGGGIDPEFLPYVFDRFRQADPTTQQRRHGLGLGLAISRQLTELHGGTIRAESAGAGQGSVFTVELPLSRPRATATATESPADVPPPGLEEERQASRRGNL